MNFQYCFLGFKGASSLTMI